LNGIYLVFLGQDFPKFPGLWMEGGWRRIFPFQDYFKARFISLRKGHFLEDYSLVNYFLGLNFQGKGKFLREIPVLS